jgi:membrane fusion protein (multidrug efflux system)
MNRLPYREGLVSLRERLRRFAEPGGRARLLMRLWGALPAIFIVFLLVAAGLLFGWIWSEKERMKEEKLSALKKDRPPVNVVLLEARPRPIRDRLNLPAVVEPWVELEVLAEVQGKVVRVEVTEGDRVKKGDVIACIDRRDYENELASARASYGLARKTLERTENLFKEEIVPRSRLDDAEAQAGSLRARVELAELMLERTVITAPISGTVNRLDAEEGLYLKLHDPVAVVLDTGRVKVSVGIPESDVAAVREVRSFQVTIDALGGKVFSAGKHFLSKAPDTRAHLYRLELALPNPSGKILPGMFARVDIVKKEVRDAISVPIYSVITRDQGRFVYVVNDEKAHMRMVETGILEGWKVEITKGLSPGDRVIVVGHRSVGEGQVVNVIRSVEDPEDLFR